MANRDLTRLHHMLDSAKAVCQFVQTKSRQDLDADRFFASAIVRELEIIGEAASAISADTRTQFPDIPWKAVIGMRNQLIHVYFDIDHDIVWKTIQVALPDLIAQLDQAIKDLSQRG